MPILARSRGRACLVAAVVAACATAWPAGDARAQSGPTPQSLAQAREEFRKGLAREAANDWEGALAIFKGVAQVKSTPQVRFHIAQCEEKIGDLVQALGSYRLALYEAEEAKTKEVEGAAKTALASLEPRIPKLTLVRGEGAASAKVVMDGRELGPTSVGAPIAVNPGSHHLEASAPGREKLSLDVTVAESETKSVELKLPEAKGAPAVAPPPTAPPPKDKPAEKPTAQPGTSPVRIAGFVLGGAGIASLAVAGVFFGMKQGAISDLDAACGSDRQSCPPDLAGTRDSGELYATVSTATLIGGAAAVAIGLGLVVFAPSPSPAPSVGLTVGPGGARFVGRF